MHYRIEVAVILGALVGVAAALGYAPNDDEKTPTVKEIMKRAHRPPKGALGAVARSLNSADPNWVEIEKNAKTLVKLGTSLTKNEPPQGEKESWDKLTQKYLAATKDLEAAAAKEDKPKALAAQRKLGTSCMTCHKDHKP